ncbi:hypothetical protein ABE65_019100 [Fictibacillus phosphorivorans]|uniref:DUF1672 family protein n=1 Tax=Fictibacillus phosphorivorans TaxID=1221500 RepID=A0A168WA08_9BACL|nr:DUF1672 family protein [Fictibacillus phosphorivorans]ANC78789.1 hypothetical protein ABE65_019100 [Fictibacillus phosphorivorans]
MIITIKIGMSIFALLSILLFGGCSLLEKKEENPYVRVQDYTGKEFRLANGDKNDKIAEANREKVISGTEAFFLEKYKTKVKVNNIVGNKDGATVYVESIGEPHFHTFVVIPIDTQENVRPEGIWTQEGEVEGDIESGIYALIHEEKLNKLNNYLNEFIKKHPVVGRREETFKNTSSTGYTTPYYYIINFGDSLNSYRDQYLRNPETKKEVYHKQSQSLTFNPEDYRIVIELFMKEENKEPDQKIFDELEADIEKMDGLPPGLYTVILNDNYIQKENGHSQKDNTLMRGIPDYIIKK